ncbi:hypothetical protein CRM22_004718 [Opisthorchis felineus]|uniref:Ig-like domain-containing protein n=1 Tax=Opisthorchis felineus TaxID=147828 RepID=A0A4S2LUS4_OPIFE|nr:hypothetical protein CRM22_004718 [Opisthorchis felineus]TGZ67582.1 hypothetical protein CRM22_004718 [Opisthorchis felineus]
MVNIRSCYQFVTIWLLLHMVLHVSSLSVHIEVSPEAISVPAGTRVRVRCTMDSANSKVALVMLRQRFGQAKAESVDHSAGSTVIGTTQKHLEENFFLVMTDQDNRAELFCGVNRAGTDTTLVRSTGVRMNITYPPNGVHVTASPAGPVTESVAKKFTCKLNSTGSNPPSDIHWMQLDSAGAQLPMTDVEITPTEQMSSPNGGYLSHSTLTVNARRSSNGRRFECAAIYLQKRTPLRSEEILEVLFAPNNVRLTEKPMGGVRESDRLELTCKTSSCHPPAVIRWFEVPPKPKFSNQATNELTDLAQIDTSPAEYGGTSVSSILVVSKTYRSQQHTVFRCQVEHPGLEKPIINEHRLQVLYPPTVQLLIVPEEPVVGQTVTLSCQTSGGNPQDGFSFSWFAGSHSQFAELLDGNHDNTASNKKPVKNDNREPTIQQRKEFNQLSKSSPPEIDKMVSMTVFQDSQLNFTNVGLSQRGWYACEVSSSGGTAHASFFLDLFYQPILDRRTKQQVPAHLGETVSFIAHMEANPPSVEVTWFQLNNVVQSSAPSGYPRHYETFYASGYPYHGYDGFYEYRVRRASALNRTIRSLLDQGQSRIQVGNGMGEKHHIVAEKSDEDNLTFSLRFMGVQTSDFGAYLCQARHRLGVKEFYFQLTKKPDTDGIIPSSINITQRGSTTIVRYKPPEKPPYTRIVLRVCRRDALLNGQTGSTATDTSRPIRRDVKADKLANTRQSEDTDPKPKINSNQVELGPSIGCEDYHVAKPESGETEVYLSDAVQLYNFRLLMYQGTRAIRETPPVLWQPEVGDREVILGTPLVALAVTGACLFLILALVLVGLFVACRNRKKAGVLPGSEELKSSYPGVPSHGGRSGPGNETEMRCLRRCGVGIEMPSEIGSMRSFQPSENDTALLMHQTASTPNGTFDKRTSRLSPPNSYMTEGDYGSLACHPFSVNSGSSATNMTLLSNQIITEAYVAAARAASAAVAASVVSGSTDVYTPSTQLTGDMDSSAFELADQDKIQAQQDGPQTEEAQQHQDSNGFATADALRDKSTPQKRGLLANCSASQQNVAGGLKTGPGQERRRSEAVIPNARQGSRLSVQMRSSNSQSHSQWGNVVSGASYSSLNPSSQTNLEAAARAAAAAAVASVVQNVNIGLLMQHASSATNLNMPYGLPRPSSRAASVVGQPVGHLLGKPSTESGDGESLHSAVFGSRYLPNNCSSTGELTPTASLHQFEIPLLTTCSQQLPVSHRPHPLQRSPLHAKELGSGCRPGSGGKTFGNFLRPTSGGISRQDSQTHLQLPPRETVAHRNPAFKASTAGVLNGRSRTPMLQQVMPLYPHPAQVTGNTLYGVGYVNSQESQPQMQPHQQQYMQRPPGLGYQQFTQSMHSYPMITQYQVQPVYYQHPAQNPIQAPRLQTRPRMQLHPLQQQEHRQNLTLNVPMMVKPNLNQTHSETEDENKIRKVEYTVAPQLHSPNESNLSAMCEKAVIPETRESGEGQLCMDESSPVQPVTVSQEAETSKVPEHISRENSVDKSEMASTLEKSDGSNKNSNKSESTMSPVRKTHTPNHVMSCSSEFLNHNTMPKPREDNDTNSSLRQSPMGASFHVLGNGFGTADDDPVHNGNHRSMLASPSISRGSHVPPGQYKQQPRLGVYSATRLNKPSERVTLSTTEHTPLLIDSKLQTDPASNSAQTTHNNNKTLISTTSVTNAIETASL